MEEILAKETETAKATQRTACGMRENENHLMELSVDFFTYAV